MSCEEHLSFEEALALLRARNLPIPEEAENFAPDKSALQSLTIAEARNIETNLASRMVDSAITDMLSPSVWSSDPIFMKFADKKQQVNHARAANQVSEVEQKISELLLIRLVVEENLPFSMLSRPEGKDCSFAEFTRFVRSGLQMPSSRRLSNELLDEYYEIIRARVIKDLMNQLCDGHATIMLESSEDEEMRPITSVLLRVAGAWRANTKTYLLDTVFTDTRESNVGLYKRIAEDAIEGWVGFDRVAGIVTDNTGNVKKAREDMMRERGRLVASQDQAHVADKLMQDIGSISWIARVIKTVSYFVVHYRKYRKVRSRLEDKIEEYNSKLRQLLFVENEGDQPAAEDRRESNVGERSLQDNISRQAPQAAPSGPSQARDTIPQSSTVQDNACGTYAPQISLMDLHEEGYDDLLDEVNDENDEEEETGTVADPSECGDFSLKHAANASENQVTGDMLYAPRISRLARTMERISNVRFASAEKLLDEYRSLRPILIELVREEGFDDLYSFRNEQDRVLRDENFVEPILDDALFQNVVQAHGILSACRVYLGVLDKETSLISEVCEATRVLESALETLPLANFPEPCKENREYLLRVFKNRKEGPLPGMKRVRITLLSDLHYAAALLDPYRTPRRNFPESLSRFRTHLSNYFEGEEIDTMGRTKEEFLEEIVKQYRHIRASWSESLLMRADGDSGSRMTEQNKKRSLESPIYIWTDGKIRFPDDAFVRKAVQELIEFACRTLSISPTSTATERNFNLSGRFHSRQRSSLGPDKIRKLMFVQWNSRIIKTLSNRDMFDMQTFVESQTDPMQTLRTVRKVVSKAFRDGLQRRSSHVVAANAAAQVTSRICRQVDEVLSDTQEVRSQTTTTDRASGVVSQERDRRVNTRRNSRWRVRKEQPSHIVSSQSPNTVPRGSQSPSHRVPQSLAHQARQARQPAQCLQPQAPQTTQNPSLTHSSQTPLQSASQLSSQHANQTQTQHELPLRTQPLSQPPSQPALSTLTPTAIRPPLHSAIPSPTPQVVQPQIQLIPQTVAQTFRQVPLLRNDTPSLLQDGLYRPLSNNFPLQALQQTVSQSPVVSFIHQPSTRVQSAPSEPYNLAMLSALSQAGEQSRSQGAPTSSPEATAAHRLLNQQQFLFSGLPFNERLQQMQSAAHQTITPEMIASSGLSGSGAVQGTQDVTMPNNESMALFFNALQRAATQPQNTMQLATPSPTQHASVAGRQQEMATQFVAIPVGTTLQPPTAGNNVIDGVVSPSVPTVTTEPVLGTNQGPVTSGAKKEGKRKGRAGGGSPRKRRKSRR